ncbi:hypothetical protein LR48_Vigan106s001000 [Vigna angularis]|uniref:Uncharacterized protein n=1 Tax=Phaseolus angularis TaxID=3914 RepID=A0A0L9T574_PHAAN|nr:hypothetical protein LR48_Vigan106s001000 [Vigna angularis]
MNFICTSSFLVVEQVAEGNTSARIHSDFPHWFRNQGVARPKKRQQQAPKYVLRVPARLPTIDAPGTSSVGPPPTPTIQPPTLAVDLTPTFAIHRYPTHAVHPSPTPVAHPSTTVAADPLPPPVLITPTPLPVVIIPTPLADPTSIPSSSSIPPFETVTPSTDPDSSGDDEGLTHPSMINHGLSRMAQALGRAVHVDEVFAQTHVRKGTNQFVDERSRTTHVRSEHESAPTPDDGSNAEDDIRGTLKHQPSSSTTAPDEVVLRLMQALEQRDQEITDLRAEFTNFKALVMRVLPETSQDELNIPPTQPRPSSSLAAPQQPTSVQPSSVQPTPVQPLIEEHDDEDHSDDNYVHY